MTRRPPIDPSVRALGLAALGLAATTSALAAANRLIAMAEGETYSVLRGEEGRYTWPHGAIFYTVRGRGAPLLLVHGLYPGASSFEFRRVFEPLSAQYRVYALDLLGFGLSARPPVVYTPALYIQLLQDFARQVMGAADHPISVIASTLGAAFAVRAAAERPNLVERLVLIEPSGIEPTPAAAPDPVKRVARGLLRSPVLGETLYNVIASRPSLRYFLRHQTYADRAAVTHALVDYYHTAAHQPGARYATASLLSGMLDTPVASAYATLPQPILLVWGKHARRAPLEQAREYRQRNARAEMRVFDCGALPQDEMPDAFVREVGMWLRRDVRTIRGR